MKVFVYWATDPPTLKPQIIDSSEWKDLTKKPEPRNPSGTDVTDGTKGWLHSVSVFGRYFKGDHIAIIENPSGHPTGSIKLVKWDDDSEERIPDEMFATELIVEPPKRIMINGNLKWGAVQRMTWYVSDTMKAEMEGKGEFPMYNQGVKEPVNPYTDFVKPDESLTLHGIWEGTDNNLLMEDVEAPNYR